MGHRGWMGLMPPQSPQRAAITGSSVGAPCALRAQAQAQGVTAGQQPSSAPGGLRQAWGQAALPASGVWSTPRGKSTRLTHRTPAADEHLPRHPRPPSRGSAPPPGARLPQVAVSRTRAVCNARVPWRKRSNGAQSQRLQGAHPPCALRAQAQAQGLRTTLSPKVPRPYSRRQSWGTVRGLG